MWDVDSKDYRHTGTYEIVARVVPQSRRGSIILLHDNGATADRISNYLTLVVESLLKRELTFAPISL
jgi:peptidoglycan/xylan/chitin deacetylase (PgdA/CDA1 family)